ncbi:hypothetical protein BGZ59_007558 [Podila verticillata]|nr:hypothetical protein BGZ59_007558 [Podila verticillata]
MENLPGLQQLEIETRDRELFCHISTACQGYMGSRLEITLTEQGGHRVNKDEISSSSRNCARVVIGFPMSDASANARMWATKEHVDHTAVVDVLYWNIDCVFGELRDQDAAVLDLATLKFPSVVTNIVVDLTLLGVQGLLSMRHIFQRSILDRLHIVCTPPPSYPKADVKIVATMTAVLDAVQWSGIMFLTLSGSDIDSWIRLLSTSFGISNLGSGLTSLTIIGTGLAQLSHTSVLALHKLLFNCELIELWVENVALHDASDWGVILEVLELLPLEELHLVNVNVEGRYQSRLEALVHESASRKDRGKGKTVGDQKEVRLVIRDSYKGLKYWRSTLCTMSFKRALTSHSYVDLDKYRNTGRTPYIDVKIPPRKKTGSETEQDSISLFLKDRHLQALYQLR